MLEHHRKEEHDRHPHCDHLAGHRGGNHGPDHAHGNHPVAQHAPDEKCQHAGRTVFLVAQCTFFANTRNLLTYSARISGEPIGENNCHHHGHRKCAGKVANEYQSPVTQHTANRYTRAFID